MEEAVISIIEIFQKAVGRRWKAVEGGGKTIGRRWKAVENKGNTGRRSFTCDLEVLNFL